ARLEKTMKAYNLLMKAHQVDHYKAYATSAMREAENNKKIIAELKENTGVKIEIIDGEHEAAIIAKTDLHELILSDKTYLYVDVGGGSTELTVFSKGKTIASKSFELGTVRILNDMINPKIWKSAEDWIKKNTLKYKSIRMIGSGGNINHIFKNSGRKRGKPLTYTYLQSYYEMLKTLSYQERIAKLEMKLDRADVIIPATKIYLSAMDWSKSRKLYVPKIGLADGIIKSMYSYNLEE